MFLNRVTERIIKEHNKMRKENFDLRNIEGATNLTNKINKNLCL